MIRLTRILALMLVITMPAAAQPANDYWQQKLQYTINVKLNDAAHTLSGDISIVYTNNSPQALSFIWFHLWPNGYKDRQTALFRQVQNDEERASKLKNKIQYGFIEQLDWKADGKALTTEAHPEHGDIVKLILPKPLAPGASTTITTPFFVKIPTYFSRLGFEDKEHMLTQWYPKPAVYDRKGWHPIPYLDQGEFYSEFGSFKVNITVPSAFVVCATGMLQNKDELEAYKKIGQQNLISVRDKLSGNGDVTAVTLSRYEPLNNAPEKTLTYTADNVHDFAWFADPGFIIHYDTLQLPSGKVIDAYSYYHPEHREQWYNAQTYVEDAVRFYSNNVGEYPYPVANVVEGPSNASSGGMEYPMVTLITSPDAQQPRLDAVITHEVGHNWFYGILGSNERNHAWMDEGMNSFYQFRYEAEKYRANSILGDMPANVKKLPADMFEDMVYRVFTQLPMEMPIDQESSIYNGSQEYGLGVYLKAAMWMRKLERSIGREKMSELMKEYFSTWKFKHPYPEDFKAMAEKFAGKPLDNLFAELKSDKPL
jgi:Peptidase family M1 domain